MSTPPRCVNIVSKFTPTSHPINIQPHDQSLGWHPPMRPQTIRTLSWAAQVFGHAPKGVYQCNLPGSAELDGSMFYNVSHHLDLFNTPLSTFTTNDEFCFPLERRQSKPWISKDGIRMWGKRVGFLAGIEAVHRRGEIILLWVLMSHRHHLCQCYHITKLVLVIVTVFFYRLFTDWLAATSKHLQLLPAHYTEIILVNLTLRWWMLHCISKCYITLHHT